MHFSHLLTENGILVSFNIAKKVKQTDIKKIRAKLKLLYGDDSEKMIKEMENLIVLHTKNSINHNEIPGLILDKKNKSIKNPYEDLSVETKDLLMSLSLSIAKKMYAHDLSKEYILILVQMIISQFNITQQDINKFQQKYKNDEIENDEDGEDDDDISFF